MLPLNSIHCGDCLEVMQKIDDKSIDMILCDLPYGTTQCKWDMVIPFEPLWKHYKRIIKNHGAIVLTASQPFTSMLVMSNISMFRYEWVWHKHHTGQLNAHKQPLRCVEDIVVFYRKQCTFNPQWGNGLPYSITRKNYKGSLTVGKQRDHTTTSDGKRYPKQLLTFRENMILHPTQKPVALFVYLINTYTNEDDLVLDNCAGSGTTGVACKRTKRNFILIEKDKTYFEMAKKRIEQEPDMLF